MQSVNKNTMNLDKIDGLLGSSVATEIRRMEQARATWTSAITHSQSLVEHIKIMGLEGSVADQVAKQAKTLQSYSLADEMTRHIRENSLAMQTAIQWKDSLRIERESVRRMLDPLQDIRKGFLADIATSRLLDDVAKRHLAQEKMSELMEHATASSVFVNSMNSSFERSMNSVRQMLIDARVSSGIGQLMKSFEETNKRWVVPQALLDSLGPLQALQEQMGRLSLPVIDIASAATLAKVLGPEGIRSQLAAMGINLDGSVNVQFVQQEEGIGLSRKALELMSLLSFILAVLIPLYQEISSTQWQAATDKALATQVQSIKSLSERMEEQKGVIEALTNLVEKALAQEAKRQDERFVVLDRVVVVRLKPENGSAVEGKLLPREVVRPISKSGKWIEIQYYHWLQQEYRTGWALKKYFQRVPTTFEKADQEATMDQ